MGYFTWTDARYENPDKNGYGDYYSKYKLGYGREMRVVCPDNTVITEPYYDGYGIFDGKDIYDLAVDWNRDDLEYLFSFVNPGDWGYKFKTLAIAYGNYDDAGFMKEYIRLKNVLPNWQLEEWKRNVGITIACGDEQHQRCKYPIKITTKKRGLKYDELYMSHACQ